MFGNNNDLIQQSSSRQNERASITISNNPLPGSNVKNQLLLSHKKIRKYIEDKNILYNNLMVFLENNDNEKNFQNFIKI